MGGFSWLECRTIYDPTSGMALVSNDKTEMPIALAACFIEFSLDLEYTQALCLTETEALFALGPLPPFLREVMMKPLIKTVLKIALVGAALGIIPGIAVADDNANLGKSEYMNACAVCHGATGAGDGSYGGMLTRKPSNLTQLTKKNGGVFPVGYVYQAIDGRKTAKEHGEGAMPVWGARYTVEADRHYSDFYGEYKSEAVVRARILSLIDYLNTIQKK